jgi:ribosomal RNA-processing protein 1
MWMSDKPLIQQQLCNDLADLTLKLSKNHVINWLMSFWITMGREWPGIDKYR